MSKESKVKVTARVRLTIDIPVDDVWGGDCPTSQVHRQAMESARNCLMRGFVINGLTINAARSKAAMNIVGEPKVTMVLVTEES